MAQAVFLVAGGLVCGKTGFWEWSQTDRQDFELPILLELQLVKAWKGQVKVPEWL